MWSAAGHDDSTPVLDWLGGSLNGALVGIPRRDQRRTRRNGWSALRTVFRMWSVHEREDLTGWLRRHGFPGTQKTHLRQGSGAHLHGGLPTQGLRCPVAWRLCCTSGQSGFARQVAGRIFLTGLGRSWIRSITMICSSPRSGC